jgi:hypothetical protein
LLDLDRQLAQAQAELERDWNEQKRPGDCPKRTLLVPLSGGPVFVPVSRQVDGADLQPKIAQADINAAINLALRAIADPRLWAIHPRLRTQREGGDTPSKGKNVKMKATTAGTAAETRLFTREKRKYGEAGKPLVVHRPSDAKPDDTRQPNFFADYAGLAELAEQLGKQDPQHAWLTKEWASAKVSGEPSTPPLVHGKSFWGCVKAAQWQRIQQINEERIAKWKDKLNPMAD